MATGLSGYSSLVTTLIAGCYVTEQYTECLKLINSLDNGGQQDAFLLLVKGKFTFRVYSHWKVAKEANAKIFFFFFAIRRCQCKWHSSMMPATHLPTICAS